MDEGNSHQGSTGDGTDGVPPIPPAGAAAAGGTPPAAGASEHAPSQAPPAADGTPPAHVRLLRMPSARAGVILAAVMLGIGVAAGAAISPAPPDSSALGSLASRLPLLLGLGHSQSQAPAPQASAPAETAAPPAHVKAAKSAAAPAATPASSEGSSEASSGSSGESSEGSSSGKPKKKLPAIGTVWLIQLDGPGFSQALEKASAAPYLTGTAIPQGALLKEWSAVAAGAFANEAAIAETPAPGAAPPLVHSIVQPPCPEGAAGAACTAETPGQLTTADTFLKETLAQITGTPAYREHGLVVITFASVGLPAQQGLPAGASSATLTSQPPAGALVLSPFATKGSRPSTAFNPTSPRQSLEALLR